ncbi:hypothetical protein SAMN05421770_106212 [Granulicella rosea]|uniref:Ribbon-helix-helix protein, copG family n=1 Tax=Granulicella rosea TaxID=474952 RepID=A0A239L9Q0_9BACT|nr:hypothetical protein [Granulicella rosea]SNT27035.1 hypothetical protein SAMN05421770_106212 [Granulicella rosea]
MSNRTVARPASTAFANLKPTIIRQPARSPVSAESEARLLDSPPLETTPAIQAVAEQGPSTALPGQMPALLQRRRKPVLIPVTFRMPQPLKDRLEKIAAMYEINQTDLINEAIELNLKRYLAE